MTAKVDIVWGVLGRTMDGSVHGTGHFREVAVTIFLVVVVLQVGSDRRTYCFICSLSGVCLGVVDRRGPLFYAIFF